MRKGEEEGVDYYFLSAEEFRRKIAEEAFVEWQEVYPGRYYGTLKSEIERIWNMDRLPIFDVDVEGGLNLRKYFGEKALAVFVQPPNITELRNRLKARGSETQESLEIRAKKAEKELAYAPRFDEIIINDNLEEALAQADQLVQKFIAS